MDRKEFHEHAEYFLHEVISELHIAYNYQRRAEKEGKETEWNIHKVWERLDPKVQQFTEALVAHSKDIKLQEERARWEGFEEGMNT